MEEDTPTSTRKAYALFISQTPFQAREERQREKEITTKRNIRGDNNHLFAVASSSKLVLEFVSL